MSISEFIKKHKLMPIIYLVILLVLIGAAVIWIYKSGMIAYFSSYEALEAYLNSKGSGAPLFYFILQVLQVLVAPIPGNITTLVASAVFGLWKGFLTSFAGVIVGSFLAFLIGRVFGRPIVSLFAKEETINRYLSSFSNRQNTMLFIFFVLPFFPDDALCFIAGLTTITPQFFLFATVCGRPFGLLISAIIGKNAVAYPWWAYILGGIFVILAVIAAFKIGPIINQKVDEHTEKYKRKLKELEQKAHKK